MSGWLGFNTAVSGLLSSQRSLYTTNHNIANANTEGYSRQIAKQQANTPLNFPGVGMLGTGTEISEITRIRDEYMNFKYWGENGPAGEWEIKRNTLVEIENLFNEPSEDGLRKNLDEFFGALETLSTNPSDYAHRSLVREKAVALTNLLNETAHKLYNVQKELNFAVSTKIKQVNDYADQIRHLNEQIFKLELDGTKANDLRDKRELLIDKLSKIVNVQTSEHDGKYKVSIGGIALVDHISVSRLKYPPNVVDNPLNPKEKLVQVQWETGNQEVQLKSGELKGLLDVRDGNESDPDYRGIPFYITRLNEFAQKMFEKMNEVHHNGSGLNGSENKFLFTIDGKNTSDLVIGAENGETIDFANPTHIANYKDFIQKNVRADNITLSGDIIGDLDNIAAAYDNNGVENNGNILELIALREDRTFFDTTTPQGTPDDFVKSILSTLSVDSQQASRMNDNQTAIMENIELRRDSESGVSIDEEMSNMVKYQHSYNAAARMITTIDAIYDVTINRLGLVGR